MQTRQRNKKLQPPESPSVLLRGSLFSSPDRCNSSSFVSVPVENTGYIKDNSVDDKFSSSFKRQLYSEILQAGGFHRDIISDVLNTKPDLYGNPNSARRKRVQAIIQYSKKHPPTHRLQGNAIFLSPSRAFACHSPPATTMTDKVLDKFKPAGFPDSWIGMCRVQYAFKFGGVASLAVIAP